MKQRKLLFILLALLVVAVAYAWWKYPRLERVALETPRSQSQRKAAKEKQEGVEVRLDLLKRKEGKFSGVQRDLFASARPVSPPPVAPPPPPPVLPPPVVVPPVPAEELAAERMAQELARFTFLGFLQKEGIKTIFLSAGEEIFLVRKGDRFGRSQQFLVTELTADRLTIRQGEDGAPTVISLVEQTPLTLNRSQPRALPVSSKFRNLPPDGGMTPLRGGAPEPAAEGDDEVSYLPEGEDPATSPSAPAGNDESLLKPLPRSDFNNLFSSPR